MGVQYRKTRGTVFTLTFGQAAEANTVDLDQTPRSAASDLGLQCLTIIQEYKGIKRTFSSYGVRTFKKNTVNLI